MTAPSTRAARFTAALDGFFHGDIDTFLTLYGERSVHTFPFAPPGMPNRVEGRADIERWMRGVPGIMTFRDGVRDLRILEGPDSLTAEWSATGYFPDGSASEMSYVAVVTFAGDDVVEYHDYMNPLGLMRPAVNER